MYYQELHSARPETVQRTGVRRTLPYGSLIPPCVATLVCNAYRTIVPRATARLHVLTMSCTVPCASRTVVATKRTALRCGSLNRIARSRGPALVVTSTSVRSRARQAVTVDRSSALQPGFALAFVAATVPLAAWTAFTRRRHGRHCPATVCAACDATSPRTVGRWSVCVARSAALGRAETAHPLAQN